MTLSALQGVIWLLLALSVASSSPQSSRWTGLRAHYSPNGPQDGYYPLPTNTREVGRLGWVQVPDNINTVYCPPNDPSVCAVFHGGVAVGFQIGLKPKYLKEATKYVERDPIFQRKRRFGTDVFVMTAFIKNPATQRDEIFVPSGPRGNFLTIPREESKMASTHYKRQNCVPGMGVHYYYNMTRDLDCDQPQQLVGLFDKGHLIGMAIQRYGAPEPGNRWFETRPASAIRGTIPDSPDCMVDRVTTIGMSSVHVYFTAKPWEIKCQ